MVNDEFLQQILDPNVCLAVDLSTSGNSLVIALGGVQGRLGLRDEVFAAAFSEVQKKRILMRDPHKAYFLKGLPELGENISEVADHFEKLIVNEGITHLSLIGQCMGGFTAIL